jgi:hypothetical protein
MIIDICTKANAYPKVEAGRRCWISASKTQ